MKTKSFTLIEILIATVIFMSVVMVAVAIFAMVKKSNETSGDMAKTDECVRQIENFTGAVFRSASYITPRIMAVEKSSGKIALRDLANVEGGELQTIGFAAFEKSPQENRAKLAIIFKYLDSEAEQNGYYYAFAEIETAEIKDMMEVTEMLSFTGGADDPEKIHSSGCAPLKLSGAVVGFAGDYEKPFHLKLSYPYGGGPSSQVGARIFTLRVSDLIYSRYSAQDATDKTFSKLNLQATNNIKPI